MALQINSRKSWGARRPRCRTEQSLASVTKFILHWPADMRDALAEIDTDREQDAYMRGIQDFHMGPSRGWCDFAYNYAVFQDGEVYRGRGLRTVPAAQEGDNSGTCAVLCVVGDEEKPSERMIQSIIALKDRCDRRCGRDLQVFGHGGMPGQATQCPGPHVSAIVPRVAKH